MYCHPLMVKQWAKIMNPSPSSIARDLRNIAWFIFGIGLAALWILS